MTPEIRARIGRPAEQNARFKGGSLVRGRRGAPHWMMPLPAEERDGRHPTMNARGLILRSHYVWNHAHPDDLVQRGEVVHHLNGDGLDDCPENLSKLPDQRAHMASHRAEFSDAKSRYWDRRGRVNLRTHCEQCGGELAPKQRHLGQRFCSYPCSVKFRTGKPRSGF